MPHPPIPASALTAHPKAPRGLSILEALAVVLLSAIMAASALPQLADLMRLRRLTTASAEWSRMVQSARSWAFNLQQPVRLELQATPPACLLLHTGSAGDCSGCTSPPTCRAGVRLLDRSDPLHADLGAWASNRSLLWNPTHRTVTPTGTLGLELTDGRAIHHVVNLVGRLRVCSPSGLVAGVPPC